MSLQLVRKRRTSRNSKEKCTLKNNFYSLEYIRLEHSTELLCSRQSAASIVTLLLSPIAVVCVFIVKQLPRQTGLIHVLIYEEAITKCGPAAAACPLFPQSLQLCSANASRFRVHRSVVLSMNSDISISNWWSDLSSRYYNKELFPVLEVLWQDQPHLLNEKP